MSKKTSAAWDHFLEVVEGKTARCNHCSRVVVIANGSTGNMFRHLKLKHPNILVDRLRRHRRPIVPSVVKAVTVPSESQKSSEEIAHSTVEIVHIQPVEPTKIASVPENTNQQSVSYYLIQPYDDKRRQEIDKQLLRVVVKNLLSFCITESEEFSKFVFMLNPSYAIPSRKTLSNDVLIRTYQSAANELKCALKDIPTVALSVDTWTSIHNEKFVSFTAHYINDKLELKSSFLGCSSFQELNSIEIALFLTDLASDWNLSDKIMAVITDESEEVMEAVINSQLNHVPCFAHILNQTVEAGLVEIKSFTSKVRKVVQYFQKNSMALSKFNNIQGQIGLSESQLVKDIPVRWDTTFDMFINFFKNKVPLLSTIEQLQLSFFQLSSADFDYLENVIQILTIFNSVKIAICSENFFSLSKIPHLIYFMTRDLQKALENTNLHPDIEKMGNKINDELKQFEILETNDLVCQGVLLDPRFKKRGFPNNMFQASCITLHHNVTSVRESLIKEKDEMYNSSQPEEDKTESEYCNDMWSEIESNDPEPEQSQIAAATVEVEAFLNDSYLPIESNPLSYWANISNQNKFPALFELAKRVLCIPATSVPCQQIYSKTGLVFLKKRKYVPSSKIDKILFLHHNL